MSGIMSVCLGGPNKAIGGARRLVHSLIPPRGMKKVANFLAERCREKKLSVEIRKDTMWHVSEYRMPGSNLEPMIDKYEVPSSIYCARRLWEIGVKTIDMPMGTKAEEIELIMSISCEKDLKKLRCLVNSLGEGRSVEKTPVAPLSTESPADKALIEFLSENLIRLLSDAQEKAENLPEYREILIHIQNLGEVLKACLQLKSTMDLAVGISAAEKLLSVLRSEEFTSKNATFVIMIVKLFIKETSQSRLKRAFTVPELLAIETPIAKSVDLIMKAGQYNSLVDLIREIGESANRLIDKLKQSGPAPE
jgi:hypothetical protein